MMGVLPLTICPDGPHVSGTPDNLESALMRGHTPGAPVTDENVYLKRRNAQLQDDVTALQAEVTRLSQQLERVMHARSVRADHDRA
jgi:hypothetical protein